MTILVLLVGCGEWLLPPEKPSVTPDLTPAPPSKYEQIRAFELPDGHCHVSETTRFDCPLQGERTASICQRGEGVAVRFGKPRQLTVALPVSGHSTSLTLSHEDERWVASVVDKGIRLSMVQSGLGDAATGRVVLEAPDGKREVFPCGRDFKSSIDGLVDTVTPTAHGVDHYLGTWNGNGLGLVVTANRDALDIQVGKTRWRGKLEEASVEATRPCNLSLRASGADRITVEADTTCEGEMSGLKGEFKRFPLAQEPVR